jgi:homocysteine S-methyltransferase
MARITLLDGGMGQELVRRTGGAASGLWATQAMIDSPGLVARIHKGYFAAGATVATANTYAIHRDRLAQAGIEAAFDALNAAALTEAETARLAFPQARIAGSIGPLVTSYRPDLHPDAATAMPLYREKARILAPRVDLLLIETAASLLNAWTALEAALSTETPVWLSVTVDDEDGSRLRSGEPLSEVLPIVRNGAAALLVNCSAPEAMTKALDILARANRPFGAYGNDFSHTTEAFLSGRTSQTSAARTTGPEAYATHAMTWLDHGATLLGGCCETGPAHIAEIARRLRAAGHEIA